MVGVLRRMARQEGVLRQLVMSKTECNPTKIIYREKELNYHEIPEELWDHVPRTSHVLNDYKLVEWEDGTYSLIVTTKEELEYVIEPADKILKNFDS